MISDSKTLTEQKREELLHTMLNQADWVGYGVHVISPVYITEKMLDRYVRVVIHVICVALRFNYPFYLFRQPLQCFSEL